MEKVGPKRNTYVSGWNIEQEKLTYHSINSKKEDLMEIFKVIVFFSRQSY